jgi:fibronectin-binding autotransporter adhesin
MSAVHKIISKNGQTMLTAKHAAKRLKCAADYVGKLCREGKLQGSQIDGVWFVSDESIAQFERTRTEARLLRSAELAAERKQESAQYRKLYMADAVAAPVEVSAATPTFSVHRFVATTWGGSAALTFGAAFLFVAIVFAGGANSNANFLGASQSATLAQIQSPFFGGFDSTTQSTQTANNSNFLGDVFAFLFGGKSATVKVADAPSTPSTQTTVPVSTPVIPKPVAIAPTYTAPATTSTKQTIIENNTYPVIEHTNTVVQTQSGISQADLDTAITNVQNQLLNQIALTTRSIGTGGGGGGGSSVTNVTNVTNITYSATSSGATGAVQFDASGAFAGDASNFFYDSVTHRLGIGTSTPTSALSLGAGGVISITSNDGSSNGCFAEVAGQLQYSNDCTTFQSFTAAAAGGWTDTGTVVHLTTGIENVGIGTSTPYAKLTLWGNGTGIENAFEIANSASTTVFAVNDAGLTTIKTLSLGTALGITNGGTGTSSQPTFGQLLVGNNAGGYDLVATSSLGIVSGTNPTFGTTSIFATAPLNWNTSNATLSITQSGVTSNGFLSSTDFATFNDKLGSTSLSNGSGISYNASTGVIANTGVLSLAATYPLSVSAATGAVTLSTAFSTTTTNTFSALNTFNGGVAANTITVGNVLATGSTTLQNFTAINATTTNATTTSFAIANVSNALLKTLSNGAVVAAVSGVDYALPGGGSGAFDFTPTTFGATAANATSTLIGFNAGLYSLASSTILNLTTGNATTTNLVLSNLYADSTGTTSVTGNIIPSANNTYALGSLSNTWKEVYIGPGSLFVNGQEVLHTDGSNNVVVSSSVNQNLVLQTTGSANIELNPSGTGALLIKSGVTLTGGKSFNTSDSSAVLFPNGTLAGNIQISGSTISVPSLTNGGISITPNGNGSTYITNGSLGIGTTNPLQKLDVAGGANVATTLTSTNLVATGTLQVSGNTTLAQATSTSFAISTIPSALLKTLSNGAVVAAIAGTDYQAVGNYATFAYPFPNNATSTLIAFTGGASTTDFTISSLGGSGTTCVQADASGKLSSTGAACGSGSGAVNSVSNSDGTLTISPTTGAVVATLNLGHSNTFTVLQQFTGGLFATDASTTNATTTNFAITNITSALLKTLSNGAVVAAVANTDYTNPTGLATAIAAAYPFPGNATSTSIAFNGGIIGNLTGNASTATTLQTSRNINGLAFNGSSDITIFAASSTLLANSNTFSGNNVFTSTITGSISGNAATVTTNANLTGVVTSVGNATSFGSFTSATLASAVSDETGSGAAVFGTNASLTGTTLASTTFTGNLYAAGATTTNLAISNISSALLKTLSNGAVVAAVANVDYATPTLIGAAYAFTPTTNYGVNTSATTTPLYAINGLFASSTSHFANADFVAATLGNATTSNFAITNIVNGLLATNVNGTVVATTSLSTNYLNGTVSVANGGTGSSTLTGILNGNGTGAVKSLVVGSGLTFDGTTLATNGAGITAIGPFGQTQAGGTQLFATSTSGTDFTITANSNTQTFNLPFASLSATGKLANADFATFNNKISSSSLSGASVISYNSGTGVITTAAGTFGAGNYVFPADVLTAGTSSVFTAALFGATATSSFNSAGALTLASALGIASGGTNNTSFAPNSLLYFDGTKIAATSSNSLYVGSLFATSSTATSTLNGGLSAAGSFFVLQNGNVGIGNSTPTKTFDVTGTARVSSVFTLAANSSCAGGQALQTDAQGNVSCGTVSFSGITTAGGWSTNSVGSVTLATTSDSVGIGATSTPYAKLAILSGGAGTTTLALLPASGQTANILDIYNTSGALSSVFTAAGNFGIGTTSPFATLSVAGNGFFNSNLTASNITATGTLSAGGTTLVTTAGGNVGLGTSSPTSHLSLVGGNFTQIAAGNPALATTVVETSGGHTYGSYISGHYDYTADYQGGLKIYDITNPQIPSLAGFNNSYVASPFARAVAVSGKYAYIADESAGLEVFDVSNTSAPVKVGNYAISGGAYSVAVSGRYVFINDFSNHAVRIIDVSNPAAPTLAATFNSPAGGLGAPQAIAVQGKYLYITDYAPAIYIVDISNPSNPALAGTYNGASVSAPNDIYLSGKYAYVADGGKGLFILNVANPSSPTLVGAYPSSGSANYAGVKVAGTYAYVADQGSPATRVFDISSPASPSLIGSVASAGTPNNINISGKYAFISGTSGGFDVVDINGVTAPAANIGAIAVNTADVSDNLNVGGDAYFGGGISTGYSGLFSLGGLSILGSSTLSAPLTVNASTTITGNLSALSGNIQFASTTLFGNTLVTNATTTSFAIANIISGLLATNANGSVVATSSISTNYLTGTLGVANGGTGSTTLGGLLTGNGTGAVTAANVTGPLTFSSNTLAINQATLSVNGFLSSTDFTTFNNKISSTSLSAVYPLAYNSGTGVFTTAFSTTTANTFSALNTFNGGVTANTLTVNTSALLASTTLTGNTLLANATTSSFAISNISNSLLKTLSNGAVVAAVAGTDYLTSATTFAYPFPAGATSSLVAFNGGLTTTGATSTGTFAVTGSTTISGLLNVGGTLTTGNAVHNGNLNVTGATTLATSLNGLLGANNGVTYAFASSSLFGYTPASNARLINTTYPLLGGGDLTVDRTLTLAFGTTTSNFWDAYNNFSSLFATNASTTNATTTNLHIINLTTGGLAVDGNGRVYSAATSTLSTISGTLALTQIASIANGTFLANGSGATAAPTAIATSSIFGTGTGGQVLAWSNGVPQWIASTTYANGAGISTSFVNGQLTITNTIAYPFPGNATSTQIAFNGGATFAGATTTALAVTGSSTVSGVFNALGTVNLGAVSGTSFAGAGTGLTGTASGLSIGGNAGTATALQTGRTINGVTFDGTGNITVTAAAGTLTGTTLNSTVVASSLTSVGTLTSLAVSGNTSLANATSSAFAITGISSGNILKTTTGGSIIAAVAGTDYVTGAGLASAFPFTPLSYGNATSTTLGFLNGFLATGSSTITNQLNIGSNVNFIGSTTTLLTLSGQSLLTASSTLNNYTFGLLALSGNTIGSNNLAEGYGAGYNASVALHNVSNSTFLGYGANSSVDNVTNSTAIGNGAQVTQSNEIVLGSSTVTQTLLNGYVGIGTTGPTSPIDVRASAINVPLENLVHSNDSANFGSRFQLYDANSGTPTVDGAHGFAFIFTNGGSVANSTYLWNYENGPMRFGVNNSEQLRLNASGGLSLGNSYVATDPGAGNAIISGNVGIGTTSPFATLSVAGNAFITGGATTSALAITGVTSSILKTLANGAVVAAVAGTDYLNSASLASAYPFQGAGNSTSTLIQFNGGLTAFASSTIGNGTQAGGLTISGYATSTLGFNVQNSTNLLSYQGATVDSVPGTNNYFAGLGANGSTTKSQGTDNVAVGQSAAFANTSSFSVFVGSLSGQGSTTGAALSGANNTGVGYKTLTMISTGHDNVALGYQALLNDTTGSNNTAVGGQAMQNTPGTNVTGSSNSAFGNGALFNVTSGNRNQAFGLSALNGLTSGDNNVAIGYQAGSNITTGYANIVLGSSINTNNLSTGGGNIGVGNDLHFPSASANNQLDIGNFIFGTLPATSTALQLPTSGSFGIGTTSPFAKFAIQSNNGDTATTLFAIGSSTASATTTLFSISNTGSTTISNGINISAGCFAINGTCLTSGSGTNYWTLAGSQLSNNSGSFVGIGTSTSYARLSVWGPDTTNSLAFAAVNNASTTLFSISDNSVFNFGANSTSTIVNNAPYAWTIATSSTAKPLFAINTTSGSETVSIGAPGSDIYIGDTGSSPNLVFQNSSTIKTASGGTVTLGSGSDIFNFAVKTGFGSTSPFAKVSIQANNGETNAILFAIGSSTASATTTLFSVSNTGSTTISNGVNITAGCFAVNGTCLSSSASITGMAGQIAYLSGTNTAVGTSSLFIASSGNIGIGTTSPSAVLTIYGSNSSTNLVTGGGVVEGITNADQTNNNFDSLSYRMINSTGSEITSTRISGVFTNHTAGSESADLAFLTRNSGTLAEAFRITGAGNVGVGTSSPFAKFSVSGGDFHLKETTDSATAFVIENSVGSSTVQISTQDTANNLFEVATSSGKAYFDITSGGNVGIGSTSPKSTLTVSGSACFTIGSGATLNCGTTAGNIYYTAANTGSYDVAEDYVTSDPAVATSSIVALDTNNPGQIVTATTSSVVLGVVSTAPGMTLGGADASTIGKLIRPVALSGRVPVLVNFDNGPIAVGDKIALSTTTPGVGMKAGMYDESVGIALEALPANATTTAIMMFVRHDQGLAATSTAGVLSTFASASDALKSAITSAFAALPGIVQNGVHNLGAAVYASTGVFNSLFAQSITVDSIQAQKLCLGATCIDEVQLKALLNGQTAAAAASIGGSSGTGSGGSSGDTTVPVLTLNGDNPATINIGDTYTDLGATVTDTANPNLGYTVSLDGATSTTPDQLQIDTSIAGKHTIVYSATDQAGNTGIATRMVNVVDPNATSTTP